MLLESPVLYAQRKKNLSNVKLVIIDCIGIKQWIENFNNKENLVQLILDSSKSQFLADNPVYLKIVKVTTEMCHNLHVARFLN